MEARDLLVWKDVTDDSEIFHSSPLCLTAPWSAVLQGTIRENPVTSAVCGKYPLNSTRETFCFILTISFCGKP